MSRVKKFLVPRGALSVEMQGTTEGYVLVYKMSEGSVMESVGSNIDDALRILNRANGILRRRKAKEL